MPKVEKILPLKSEWINIVVDVPKTEPKALVVFCHGLTGDRAGPQRILTNWAKTLSDEGFLAARFDFRGSGDSSGEFEKTTYAQMEDDLNAVVEWCSSEYTFPSIILAGLSLGGIVALRVLPKIKNCKALFLFSSDVNNTPSFDLCDDPLSIRDGQFFLHKKFFEERLTLLPETLLTKTQVPRYLIYGKQDHKISLIAKKLEPLGVNTIPIEYTGHLFESYAARSTAIHKMIDALKTLTGR